MFITVSIDTPLLLRPCLARIFACEWNFTAVLFSQVCYLAIPDVTSQSAFASATCVYTWAFFE